MSDIEKEEKTSSKGNKFKSEKFRKMLEEYRKTNKKIEKIVEKIDKKEQELLDKSVQFEKKQMGRNESNSFSIDTKISNARNASDIRTFVGSASARIAKMPFTFVARYQAIKGNKEKKEEFLKKAGNVSNRVMKAIANKNRQKQLATQKKVTARNQLEKKAERQIKRIDEIQNKTDERNQKVYEEYSSKETMEKSVKRVRRINKISKFVGKLVAVAGQRTLTSIARSQISRGKFEKAQATSNKAGAFSRNVMKKVSDKSKERQDILIRDFKSLKEKGKVTIKGTEATKYEKTEESVKTRYQKTKGNVLSIIRKGKENVVDKIHNALVQNVSKAPKKEEKQKEERDRI